MANRFPAAPSKLAPPATSWEWCANGTNKSPILRRGRARVRFRRHGVVAGVRGRDGEADAGRRESTVFSYLGPLLGMQDIQVGHPEFDATFVIKGNNEAAVQQLCGSERLRALVIAQPKFQLSIQDDDGWFGAEYPAATDVLVFDVADPDPGSGTAQGALRRLCADTPRAFANGRSRQRNGRRLALVGQRLGSVNLDSSNVVYPPSRADDRCGRSRMRCDATRSGGRRFEAQRR